MGTKAKDTRVEINKERAKEPDLNVTGKIETYLVDENGDCVIKQGTASFIQYMEDDKWAIITSGQFFAYEDDSSTYKFSKGKFYL